ncbi:MAG: flagellin [Nitrospiria bacterium]
MALTVNTNMASLNAQRSLGKSQSALQTSLARLSSGLRINSAKDDAAGLAVAAGLTKEIRGNNVAVRNAADGISLGQIAEGALGQISDNLQRIREIAVQASNGTISNTDRDKLQLEVDQLTQENSRIIDTTSFNGTKLINATGSLSFQVGSDSAANNQISVSTVNMTASSVNTYASNLSATKTVDVSTAAAASGAIAEMDTDIATVTSNRATFGAVQNRFDAVIANLQNTVENLSASRSRIVDADFAAETATLTKNQILQQAGVAILSQANTLPQTALSLLQ